MEESIKNWIINYNIGDLASIIALFITVIGFIMTLYNVRKSRTASQQAMLIVEKVRKDLEITENVTSLATAIAMMEEIKRLQRMDAWNILPERYSNLRKSLIDIKTLASDLTENEQLKLQNAISQFSNIEKKIDESLQANNDELTSTKFNTIVSTQIDSVQEILVNRKLKIGSEV